MTRRSLFQAALLASLALFAAGQAMALDYKLGALEIDNPWARATPATAKAAAGYLTVKNTGTTPDRLVAAKTPAADRATVHEMKMEGSIMRMHELEHGLDIPPGATVTLAPGGLHVMLMGLKAPLKPGSKVPLTLVFEKAGSIDIDLDVGSMGAMHP